MSASAPHQGFSREPLWFGPTDRPLFGWLTSPSGGVAKGGVALAPPIGREGYPARFALRQLAESLADRGFASLRIDYDGTGDSSGKFDDPDRDQAWLDSVVEGTGFLRSMGLTSVSAIGLRLGATIAGVAAASRGLGLTSLVLWDPCESGRTYLRELSALESLRRDDFEMRTDGSVESSEYFFSAPRVEEMRRLSLTDLGPERLAERVLVVERADRKVSAKLRRRLSNERVEWESTPDQAAMMDVETFYAVVPRQTIERMTDWIADDRGEAVGLHNIDKCTEAIVSRGPGPQLVSERSLELGPGRLFAIVSEPASDPRGPWIILLNSVNDDHVGRARLWVELSRRWASYGLRCVRVDLNGYGDSARVEQERTRTSYDLDWTEDAAGVARALSPEDPSASVFVGICSGAYVAIEAGLATRARGVVAVNPPVMMDYVHGAARLQASRYASLRALGTRIKPLALSHLWMATTFSRIYQAAFRFIYSVNVLDKLVDVGTDVLVFASTEDLTPYPRAPLFRSIDLRRIGSKKKYELEFVPGMDHSWHYADGRTRAVAILDRFVLEHFAQVADDDRAG